MQISGVKHTVRRPKLAHLMNLESEEMHKHFMFFQITFKYEYFLMSLYLFAGK